VISQALNMGCASVSELRKQRARMAFMKHAEKRKQELNIIPVGNFSYNPNQLKKEGVDFPKLQPALLSVDIPSSAKDAPAPLELQVPKIPDDEIKKFLKENFVGIVINYVGDGEGDFCYCPDCENYLLIKENYCPVCDDGEELTLEFVYEADTELSENINFMRTTASELREKGWIVIDVGTEITLDGLPCVVTRAELDREWRSWRTWIWVKREITGMLVKYPLEFIAKVFSKFSRKKS